jgi:hypothetical protein
MTDMNRDTDPLDDVMEAREEVHPHRREHAKESPRPDEDELDRKTEVERNEVGLTEGDA